MTDDETAGGTGFCEDLWLDLEAFARACGVDQTYIRTLVDEELIRPGVGGPAWHFSGAEMARVRRIRRLQRDFEANLQSVAVMLDLLDEVEYLRAALHRAGVTD
jgi:chaperone modulatory protein CbpM